MRAVPVVGIVAVASLVRADEPAPNPQIAVPLEVFGSLNPKPIETLTPVGRVTNVTISAG